MKTDQIFKTKFEKSSDFKFDSAVVDVFDDMVIWYSSSVVSKSHASPLQPLL